jgi:nucleotide-binding universal stress UspA family protein
MSQNKDIWGLYGYLERCKARSSLLSSEINRGKSNKEIASKSTVFARVLVCTDFSAASHAALEEAVKICNVTKAKLTILHVREYGPLPVASDEGIEYVAQLMRKPDQNLQAVTASVRDLGVDAEGVVVNGNFKQVILEEIKKRKIDLAVIGTQGAKGLERLIFGSTAESVFRNATCPILTVGPRLRKPSRDVNLRPIVFATDFQEPAVQAANCAVALANMHHAPLHCVHVLPTIMGNQSENPAVLSIMTKGLRELTHDASMCEIAPVFRVLYGREVSHPVVEYAREHDAQTIVLGVRRKMRVVSHLPPQITYRIMMDASCPVMTISCDVSTATLPLTACL